MATPSTVSSKSVAESTKPWWRYPFVWLVVGLPASAVVAATASGILAIRNADPVVQEYQVGMRHAAAEASIERGAAHGAMEPAERARNHAATPQR
jgi:hypothetical protein